MPAAQAHIPSAAFRSTTNSLVGPPPAPFIFKNKSHHYIPRLPCPAERGFPTGTTSLPPPIAFGHPGEWKQGVLFRDFQKIVKTMEGSDRMVLGELGISEITLWFAFPCYEHMGFRRHMTGVGKDTKAVLGQKLIAIYREFMVMALGATRQGNWCDRIVGKNISSDNLLLLELCHFDGDNWQLSIGYEEK